MRIEVTCREADNYRQTIEVYVLHYDMASKTFSMSYCWGDMWGIEMKCPLNIFPINVEFSEGSTSIRFERKDESEAFMKWLIEGEERVQRGFETMRD